ncbi:flagellar hook-associated protein [Oceanobacillus picturae]|uniref:Flagellar hook-associated protein n=1 Tax=Oceanobacillus picturae TaxID=171693 RepID=A0A0U9HEY8_9BACI|nr:hypothetical protein [Oceanobacillus picturae]GAQ17564.1 flagellar hook-associated protein [Oceanobacillus picturae]
MANKEYRLIDKAGDLSPEDQKDLEEVMLSLNKFQGSGAEATFLAGLIILPDGRHEIDSLSRLSIQKVKKTKIDYISRLDNKELEKKLEEYKKQYNLTQGQLEKITKELNKLRKDLKEGEEKIEKTKKLLKEITIQTVGEKQIKDYLDKIKSCCKQLENNLFIENPEILSEEKKAEVINRLDVLENFIEELRKQFA